MRMMTWRSVVVVSPDSDRPAVHFCQEKQQWLFLFTAAKRTPNTLETPPHIASAHIAHRREYHPPYKPSCNYSSCRPLQLRNSRHTGRCNVRCSVHKTTRRSRFRSISRRTFSCRYETLHIQLRSKSIDRRYPCTPVTRQRRWGGRPAEARRRTNNIETCFFFLVYNYVAFFYVEMRCIFPSGLAALHNK